MQYDTRGEGMDEEDIEDGGIYTHTYIYIDISIYLGTFWYHIIYNAR